MTERNFTINYIEMPMVEKAATMAFYNQCFGWTFTEWGEDYISFAGAGLDGGFRGDAEARVREPGALVVLYADALETAASAIQAAGGQIVKPIFSFPGGRRFHFHDPNGNELAVWSDQ